MGSGEVGRGMGGIDKGDWEVQTFSRTVSHREGKCSTGTVMKVVTNGDRWWQQLPWRALVTCWVVELVCCTPVWLFYFNKKLIISLLEYNWHKLHLLKLYGLVGFDIWIHTCEIQTKIRVLSFPAPPSPRWGRMSMDWKWYSHLHLCSVQVNLNVSVSVGGVDGHRMPALGRDVLTASVLAGGTFVGREPSCQEWDCPCERWPRRTLFCSFCHVRTLWEVGRLQPRGGISPELDQCWLGLLGSRELWELHFCPLKITQSVVFSCSVLNQLRGTLMWSLE